MASLAPASSSGNSQWYQSSLPPKTLAGFIAAIVAIVAICWLSYKSLEDRSEGAARVSETVAASQRLDVIVATLSDAETGQRGFLLTRNERYLEPYNAAAKALPRTLDDAKTAFKDNAEQTRRLFVVEALIGEKMAELEQTVSLARGGKPDQALAIVQENRGKDWMDRLRATIEEMKAEERAKLDARTRDWERSASVSVLVTWGGSALLLFLVGAAAAISSRDFREQKLQAWLRTAQTDLAIELQGEQSLKELGNKIVAYLSRYMQATVGAVYFAEREDQLKQIGTYATGSESGRGEKSSPALKRAGGLTRQAFENNNLLHVTEVPDEFFTVSAGVGKAKAKQVVVAPATSDGRPVGVVELGFFRAVTPADLELLRRVAEPIGVALRSAKYRITLQNLLEETQRQSEELQTQQEELRVSNEELEQQSRALMQSQERLKNQQAELEQINAQLEEQAQSLELQRDDLTRAQSELQRASAYKSEFLANMSHELRTPLNSSLILAKLLMDNREGHLDDEEVKFARTIYSAGNDLLTLINDILDLSRIEAGKLEVRPEEVVVARLVDDQLNIFEPVAKDRSLSLEMEVASGVPARIHTDPIRLQQILKNLISNALKFTEKGGVSLRLRRGPAGRILFEVADTGIGIPKEKQGIIFDAFKQAEGSTNRKYGGTGLGLSISRDLARLLGGELTVDSAPGHGSTFTLSLPETHTAREAGKVGAGSATPAVASVPPVRRRSSPQNGKALVPLGPLAPGARAILIIEDDVAFAQILAELAGELDFKPLIAHTAEQGLAMADHYKPSAIVLDIGLPDRSGLTVLDALKHNKPTRHIPVHVISGVDHAQVALQMGATGYAIKPVEREELLAALRRLESKITQKVRNILVVEDDEVHRESTSKLLASDDVHLVAVATAREALENLSRTTFDCMVLDLSLPDRTGFDLLEEMASKEQYAFPPVIVYTGRTLTHDEEQQLRRFSSSIIIKGARSPERLIDEVTLFLHQVEDQLPPERQRMLRAARHRDAVFEEKRVLVVEDDVRNIFALTSMLEPRGAKVEIARNGREALAHLTAHPGVDLVLMDIMMPEMDGLEATREIRKNPAHAKLPIIALTAKAMLDDREECIAAGANDYIAKPLEVDKLLSLARVWMRK